MKKAWIGWVFAVIFVFVIGVLGAAYSNLRHEHTIETSKNYYDFYSAMNNDIQMMEQVLLLEKSFLEGNGDFQTLKKDSNELALSTGIFSILEMPEKDREQFSETRSTIISTISAFQKNGAESEVEALENSIAAYKQQFEKWLDKENKCAHIEGFCAGQGSEVYQPEEK